MLDATPDDRPLSMVGETFDMDMDREPLGDIPDMKKYQIRNTVTKIIPDHLIEWAVGFADQPPIGHVYGWQLDAISEAETEVTNYCDWTGISEERRARRTWPIVPVSMLERSVENLDRLASR